MHPCVRTPSPLSSGRRRALAKNASVASRSRAGSMQPYRSLSSRIPAIRGRTTRRPTASAANEGFDANSGGHALTASNAQACSAVRTQGDRDTGDRFVRWDCTALAINLSDKLMGEDTPGPGSYGQRPRSAPMPSSAFRSSSAQRLWYKDDRTTSMASPHDRGC